MLERKSRQMEEESSTYTQREDSQQGVAGLQRIASLSIATGISITYPIGEATHMCALFCYCHNILLSGWPGDTGLITL